MNNEKKLENKEFGSCSDLNPIESQERDQKLPPTAKLFIGLIFLQTFIAFMLHFWQFQYHQSRITVLETQINYLNDNFLVYKSILDLYNESFEKDSRKRRSLNNTSDLHNQTAALSSDDETESNIFSDDESFLKTFSNTQVFCSQK